MAAVAKRERISDPFVGQVLARSSPVLTWRPVQAVKVAPASAPEVEDDRESSVHRISRLPTTRMVVWPVIPRVRRARSQRTWASPWRAAMTVVVAAALILVGAAASAWQPVGLARVSTPAEKVTTTRALDDGRDALVPVAPAPAAVVAPAHPAPVVETAPPAAAPRGRAHHAKRHVPPATR